MAQPAPRLAHVGLCSPRYTSLGARLALVKRLGPDVVASLAALYQPLLGMAATVAYTGAKGDAAYLRALLGPCEQVAAERRRISSLARAAVDRNSWHEFSEAALSDTGALARRWAEVGEAALLAGVAIGGSTRFDPVELVASLRRKWRAAWNASHTLDGGVQPARLLSCAGLPAPTRAEARQACARFPSRVALLEGVRPRLFARAGSATLDVLLAYLYAMEAGSQAPPTQRVVLAATTPPPLPRIAQRRPISTLRCLPADMGAPKEATCPQLVGAGSFSLPCLEAALGGAR